MPNESVRVPATRQAAILRAINASLTPLPGTSRWCALGDNEAPEAKQISNGLERKSSRPSEIVKDE